MRTLTQSFGSFSIALTLLGAQQLTRLVSRPPAGSGEHPATATFDGVAREAGRHLDAPYHRVFAAGDRMQRGFTDFAWRVASGDVRDPRAFARLAGDLARESTSAMRELVS